MSQLIQLRNRLKAIKTIKKITHAMRLISMSMHAKTKERIESLDMYKTCIAGILKKLRNIHGTWNNEILMPCKGKKENVLAIVAGSQKGLCGNFNSNISSFFKSELGKTPDELILIGRKLFEQLSPHYKGLKVTGYESFSQKDVVEIANEITEKITSEPTYTSVIFFNNYSKNFFRYNQKKTVFVPLPADIEGAKDEPTDDKHDYNWEHNPELTLNEVASYYLSASLQHALLETLLAEQATRFISMDSSTRNAESMLEEMELEYNKMRQSKITQELAELSGNL